MKWSHALALVLALAAALSVAGRASADIIDFDPAVDEAPELLSPDELSRYAALQNTQAAPSILANASPDGRYALVRVGGRVRILDTVLRSMEPVVLGTLSLRTTPAWRSDTELVALSYDARARRYGKTVIDCATGLTQTTPVDLPAVPGKGVSPVGGPLIGTADGTWRFLALTTTPSQPPLRIERPTYAAPASLVPEAGGTVLAIGAGLAPPIVAPAPDGMGHADEWVLQTQEELLAVSLDDGSYVTIDTFTPRTDLGTLVYSVSARPGSTTVSYVAGVSMPWAGTVVRGRSYRGGGMSTNYWSTREALGLIPLADNPYVTERSLRLLDLATGDRQVLENRSHGGSITAPAQFSRTRWTADGSLLLVDCLEPFVRQGRHPSYANPSGKVLKVYQPDGRFVRDLKWREPPLDGTSTSYFGFEGTRLLVAPAVNTSAHLYTVDASLAAEAQTPVPLYTGHRLINGLAFGGDTYVATIGDVTTPPELYVGRLSDFEATQQALTDANAALRAVSRIAYEPITYRTSQGVTVTGLYVYPADWSFPPPEPKPLVVWQMGGPGGQMQNGWATSVESPYSLLPNFGIPVLVLNGSGRQSNGADFYAAMAVGTSFGQRDIADVKEGVEHLIAQGIVDPNAVGVTGCSYGGYFTLQSLTTYPDFYRAGNAQCSLNDLLYEYNFGWSPTIAYLMGAAVTEAPEEYVRDSPVYNASRIEAPLLVFHGTDDFLPFEHMTNIHDQVEASGVPARFLRAHGYGHGLGSTRDDPGGANAQRYAFQLQLTWFRRHLAGGQSAHGALAPVPFEHVPWLPLLPDLGDLRRAR